MAKYHLKEDGNPGKCTARFRSCPLGASADEHYNSPEEARGAYEEKMEQQARNERANANLQRLLNPPPAFTPKNAEADSREKKLVLDALNENTSPEELVAWADLRDNSFKAKLGQLHRGLQEGKYTEAQFANIVTHSAAGVRSGLTQKAKQTAEHMVKARHQRAMEEDYYSEMEKLSGNLAPVYDADLSEVESPFAETKFYSDETYVNALEKYKVELEFVGHFTKAYDEQFHPKK